MAKMTSTQIDALNSTIDAKVLASRARMDVWRPMYESGIDYMYNNQTEHLDIKEGFDRIQSNMLYPIAMQEMALLMQRHPAIVALPLTDEEEDSAAASVWNDRLRWEFQKNLKIPEWMTRARLDGKTAGFWIGKVYWDPRSRWDTKQKKWIGKVKMSLIKPTYFGVDPDTESIEGAEYVYTERQIATEKAIMQWPKHKEAIQAAAVKEFEKTQFGSQGYTSAASTRMALDGSQVNGEPGPGVGGDYDEAFLANFVRRENGKQYTGKSENDEAGDSKPTYVTITEIFIKDREEVGKEETAPMSIEELTGAGIIELRNSEPKADGEAEGIELGEAWYFVGTNELLTKDNWPEKTLVPKDAPLYPNGRFVLRIGKAILNDDVNDQIWPYKYWPYVIGMHNPLPHIWQGLNGVEMSRGLQDFRNLGLTHVLNHVQHFDDPMWLAEEGAIAGGPESEDGEFIETTLGSRPGKIVMVKAGKIDKVQAVKPPALGEGAPAAIRLAAEDIRDTTGVQEVLSGKASGGRITATEILKLETNTKLRVGLQSFYEDVFLVEIGKRILELNQANLVVGDMIPGLSEEQKPVFHELNARGVSSEFDLNIQVTSELPYDKEREKLEADKVYATVGLPYLKEWLEAHDVPNVDEVLSEMPDWIAYQQFRAAQDAAQAAEEQAQPTQATAVG